MLLRSEIALAFDLLIQGIMFLIAIVSILPDGEVGLAIVLIQPLLGLWQISSALICLFRYGYDKNRVRYLLAIFIYFLIFWLLYILFPDATNILGKYMMICAWIIATSYLYLTYRELVYLEKVEKEKLNS